MEHYEQFRNIKIAFYSGTGCTQRVANCFKSILQKYQATVELEMIHTNDRCYIVRDNMPVYDLLVLIFPVHAFNAPHAVYKWIQDGEQVNKTKAVVISVSGGGEVIPNTGCRAKCIRLLRNKGYIVSYERMIVMPSNWIVPTPKPAASMLLKILPHRVDQITKQIYQDVKHRTKPFFIDRIFSYLGQVETIGGRWIGHRIKVKDTCSGCGWCSRNCPSGNIIMDKGIPQFQHKCHICLKCIYGCPCKALGLKVVKFIVIKDGFDLKEMEQYSSSLDLVSACEFCKGVSWNGVKKYLLEDI